MPFPELGAVALEKPDLLLGHGQLPLGSGLLGPKKPLVLGEEVVAAPDTADAARTHLHPAEHELISNALCAVGRVVGAVGQNGILDLLADTVRSTAGAPPGRAASPARSLAFSVVVATPAPPPPATSDTARPCSS